MKKKEAGGGWKKGKAQRNYERANTLVQWITLLYFLVYVWCCCFYSGHSCQQHRRSCQQGEGERESERHTGRYREGEGARKTPIQKELNWLPSICTDTEHTYLLQTEEEQTTNPALCGFNFQLVAFQHLQCHDLATLLTKQSQKPEDRGWKETQQESASFHQI